jgi:ABC-2 type transport system ATP-binding protein
MADRVGVIRNGEIILVEDKAELMRKLGKKQLTLHLDAPLGALPPALSGHDLELAQNGRDLVYTYSTKGDAALTGLLGDLAGAGIGFRDLDTKQSSLEDIFVDLVKERA